MLVKYRQVDARFAHVLTGPPYRWWTPDMEPTGKYHEANSVEDIQAAAGSGAELQDVTDHI
jgi:hypothetical protein